MTDMSLRTRVKWIIIFRLAFLMAMMGSGLVLYSFYEVPFSQSLRNLMLWGFGGVAVSWILHGLLKRHLFIALAWSQIIWDLGFTTVLVHLTGGFQSAYVLLYVVNILMGAVLFYSSGAIAAGFLAGLAFAGIAFLNRGTHLFEEAADLSRLIFSVSALWFFAGGVGFLFKNRERLAKSLEQTTADLMELNQIHSAIVNHIPSGIIYLDDQNKLILSNPAAKKILGRVEELQGTIVEAFLREDARFESQMEVDGVMKSFGHSRVGLPNGGSVIVFQDLTGIRDLETRAQTQEKLAAVGQLGAGIAHEIRNPLASLSGSVQLLKSEFSVDSKAERLMKIVLRETDRLDALCKNFLDYAKPSQVRAEEVNVRDSVHQVISLLQNSSEYKSKAPTIENLVSKEFRIFCDPKQWEQILWNLLKNGVDAVRSGGKITVDASEVSSAQGMRTQIRISDNGVGISEDNRKQIFNPFFTTKGGGTGLGLALVYQMLKAHDATVQVHSKVGSGTTFYIEFNSMEQGDVAYDNQSSNTGG